MRKKLFVLVILILLPALPVKSGLAVEGRVAGEKARPVRSKSPLVTATLSARFSNGARAFVGQDLHLAGGELLFYQSRPGEHILVLQDGFSMSVGANQFSSDSAVVWLKAEPTEFRGRVDVEVNVQVYLEGNVSLKKTRGAKTTGLSETVVEKGESMVVRFGVSGEVFVTAEKREIADPRELPLYAEAFEAVAAVEPEFTGHKVPGYLLPVRPVPELPAEKIRPKRPPEEDVTVKPVEVVPEPEEKEPRFRYPVNISPAGEAPLKMESARAADGTDIATVMQRFYVWQKQDEEGGLLELQADRAVIFYSSRGLGAGEDREGAEDVLAGGTVKAIYMSGDVVMTEGQRTIRAEEMYYDFERKKGLAIGAVMRSFDAARGIPIYVRGGSTSLRLLYLPSLSSPLSRII